jgi:uncharacterized delta-60 repeat protein
MFSQISQTFFYLNVRPCLLYSYSLRLGAVVFALFLLSVQLRAALPGDMDPNFTAADARVLTKVGTIDSEAREVLIQPDGKIVVAGKASGANVFGDFALVRYNSDGSLDTSFDGDGIAIVSVGTQDSGVAAAVLQPDGKIVVVGGARSSVTNTDGFAVVRFNSNGSLDDTFGSGGKVISTFSDNSGGYATSVVLQADNKIVVSGVSSRGFTVVRYNQNGTLDQSFGTNGVAGVALGNRTNAAQAAAIQSDGKIVLAGYVSTETATGTIVDQFGLARFNADGSLDNSFDNDGKVLTSIGDYNFCTDLVIQSDGKIVVAGITVVNSSNNRLDFALARYNSDGSLDTNFGDGGKVLTAVGNGDDRALSLIIRPNGKLIVAGETQQIFGAAPFAETNSDFALAQYNSDGSLDTTFGFGGKVITPVATNDTAYDAALQADGKLVVVGEAAPRSGISIMAVVRYQPTGMLDQSFGFKIPGSVSTVVHGSIDEALAVAVQPDGKIVSVGRARVSNRYYFAIVRQNIDGTLDTRFGNNGTIITKIGAGDTDGEARAVALQADGKIVVAGRLYDANNSSLSLHYFALARYNPDGTLDQTFDADGMVVIPAPNESNEAFAVAIQPNGKIVVAGFYDTLAGGQINYDVAVARLESNGSLDSSFDNDGIATTDLGGFVDTAYALVVQADGKILIGGAGGLNTDFALVRYNSNGSLDNEFGTGGKVLTPMGTSLDEIRAIALQTDGKIVAAGNVRVGTQSDFGVARYNSNGALDPTFDGDGKVITPILSNSIDNASSVVVQANGNIIVVGTSTVGTSNNTNSDISIVRYTSTGALDTRFSSDGIVTTDYASYGYAGETATGAALDLNGNLIIAGSIRDRVVIGFTGDRRNFLLARYIISSASTLFDYDGDGRADVSVFRPSAGAWYISHSSNNSFFGTNFGQNGDIIAPADFDGDGRTDISVFRQGFWYRTNSSTNQFVGLQFGIAEDIPVPADFDGDGRADIAVFRPSNSTWYRLNSSDNQFVAFKWGASGDKPLVGDFDGDGKSDYAVFRPSAGAWYVLKSTDNSFYGINFGISEDIPTPADYDADGKTDISVFRPSAGSWYRINSSTNQFFGQQFGIAEDKPVAADYDGDGRADLAVFRPSAGAWYIQRSTSGFFAQQFGSNGDIPTPFFSIR